MISLRQAQGTEKENRFLSLSKDVEGEWSNPKFLIIGLLNQHFHVDYRMPLYSNFFSPQRGRRE